MLSLVALAMIASSSPSAASCPGTTTIDVNACLAAHFGEADADLNLYYDMAVRRVRNEGGTSVAKALIQAERSWLSYRNAECGAVSRNIAMARLERAWSLSAALA